MTHSPFSEVTLAPADPILGLTEAFVADKNPNKVNLGVGVYQDGKGKVPVLSVVREAERRWYEKEDSKAYLPIDGLAT
jgi:aromatic-amino-acid transaminase